MVRTQIQLTEKQSDLLKKMAMTQTLSIAEIIRQAVDNYIKSNTAINTEERIKKVLELSEKYNDSEGKRNVSKKHDDYLVEAYRGHQ
ncbi:MAG: ribbon-helix-helix protein, CopG family [Deltaproteobacteria bacterium]|nr:ribbon-helix-helix protein, CopG family [Deltaproteobacteria bacterium]